MSNLAVVEKMEKITLAPQSRLMVALEQSIPKGCGITPARLLREAMTVVKSSEALQKASEYSLFCSIAEVAEAGLSLNLHLGQAYLVPFSGNCTVIYGYRGLCELARRSREIVGDIVGEIRYAKDEFEIRLGSHRELVHVPFDGPQSKRGAIVGSYATAELAGGKSVFEYMDAEEIERIASAVIKRAQAKGKKTIWETENKLEMWRKTPVRRLGKRLPQSPSLNPFIVASTRDEYREAGIEEKPAPPTVEFAEALDAEHIDPEPPKAQRKSAIKEIVEDFLPEEQSGQISGEQFDQIYSLIGDLGLTMQQLVSVMKKLGHKGTPKQFPAAKFDALVEAVQKATK